MRLRSLRLMTVLVTAFSLLLTTSMVLFTYRVLDQEIQQNTQVLKQHANAFANNLVATGAESLLNRDYAAIERLLLRTIAFPGIDEIQVADIHGRVLSDVVLVKGQGVARFRTQGLVVPDTPNVSQEIHPGKLVIWQPVVLGELLGWVRVTHSLSVLTAIKQRIWTGNVLFGAILLASTIILVVLVLRKPMRNLREYAEFADRLSEKSGKQIHVGTASSELVSLGNALNRAAGQLYGQDIVIRKGVEELERLAAFPEKSPDIVLSLNCQGVQQYLNPAGLHELSKLGLAEGMIHTLLPTNYLTLLEKSKEKGRAVREIEAEYAGHVFKWTFSPIVSRDLVHCYGIEVTAHKQAEEQAKSALIEKGAAEVASQTKSLFLANMSHEIRTPLTAIIGFSEALLDVNQSMSDRVDGIQTINRAGKHLLKIINDILDLSKIEAGHLEVEQLSVPLFELVEEVASLARLQAESKAILFVVEPAFPLPLALQSDPVRIRQILLNLISNAIKFTEQGSVTLRMRYNAGHNKLELEVSDTGIGMNPGQLSCMFQAFTQADASITRRFGGTGLGLALSKQLAEKLGGTITVESTPGQGSRFTFTLNVGPVTSLVNSPAEGQQTRQPITQEKEVKHVNGTILLAEDNPDNQRLIILNARTLGAKINVVENGELAVKEALAGHYDLVLMDMQMPVMDGLTATRTLRGKGYRGPIVALTANATQQDMQSCLNAGCDDFLTKPIERNKFSEVLHKYLLQNAEQSPSQNVQSIIPPMLEQDPGLTSLVEHFVGRMIAYHQNLVLAMEGGEIQVIRQQAKKIKLIGSDYMFPQITEIAGRLEFAAAAGNNQAALDLVEKLGSLISQLETSVPRTDQSPSATPIDESPIISELLQEGPEIAELIPYFLERLPGYLKGLHDAQSADDMAALKKQAHDLRAVGGGYGYPQITELAAKIQVATENAPGDLAALIKTFEQLARRIDAGAKQSG